MQKDLSNLHNLRNLLKRDPGSYRGELLQQLRHFESQMAIFRVKNAEGREAKEFGRLIEFVSHAAPFFPKLCKKVPEQLMALLSHHHGTLSRSVRRVVAQSLILLSNRDFVPRLKLLPVFFELFACPDKQLRKLLFNHIVNDIKRVNKNKRDPKLNRTLQNFMFTMLASADKHRGNESSASSSSSSSTGGKGEPVASASVAAKTSLNVMIDLWRRRVWRDDKTVNAIAQCCFSKESALLRGALHFFIGMPDYEEEDESDDEIDAGQGSLMIKSVYRAQQTMRFTSRRKKRQREIKRAVKKIKRKQEGNREGTSNRAYQLSMSAIELVYEPQQFAERLFSQLKRSSEPFETRLLMMNVISRLVGTHKLLLFNFYPFLQKYMQPHQRFVTRVLTFLAQASHDLVPEDVLQPCIATLANHFVTDRSSAAVMAVGLNAIREVCARCPLSMTATLLQDLAQYKKSKEKGVMMAARSLIALFRELRPSLLHRKDLGRETALALADDAVDEVTQYGQEKVITKLPGIELLERAVAAGAELPTDDTEWEPIQPEVLKQKRRRAAEMSSDEETDSDDDVDPDEVVARLEDAGMPESIIAKAAAAAAEEDEEGSEDEVMEAQDEQEQEDDEDDDEEDGDDKETNPVLAEYGLAAQRFLTPRDLERIRALEMQQKLERQKGGNKRTRRDREDGAALLKSIMPGDVDESDIVGFQKKRRQDKADRLASVLEGREGRDKFGRPKAKGGGLTNEAKLKNQPFMMVKHSYKVKGKSRAKFAVKQRGLSKHIKNLKKAAKNKHRM